MRRAKFLVRSFITSVVMVDFWFKSEILNLKSEIQAYSYFLTSRLSTIVYSPRNTMRIASL